MSANLKIPSFLDKVDYILVSKLMIWAALGSGQQKLSFTEIRNKEDISRDTSYRSLEEAVSVEIHVLSLFFNSFICLFNIRVKQVLRQVYSSYIWIERGICDFLTFNFDLSDLRKLSTQMFLRRLAIDSASFISSIQHQLDKYMW